MTIEQVYKNMDSDYASVKERLQNDALIEKFLIKFLADESYANIAKNLETQNIEEAFRAAHTLKGVSANLGFEQLRQSASALTEFLRGKAEPVPAEALPLLEQVRRDYQMTVDAIRAYRAERF